MTNKIVSDKSKQIGEIFWFDKFNELYRNGNYKKILIKKNMNRNEFFNAVTRCIILIAIILLIIIGSVNILGLLFVILIMIIVIYYLMQYSINDDNENFDNVDYDKISENTIDSLVPTNTIINNLYTNSCRSSRSSNSLNNSLYDNKYKKLEEINSIYNFSNLQNNINVCDFNPSNISEDKINDGYNNYELNKLRSDMFETVDNVFEKKNHERQFNTIPNHSDPTAEDIARKWIYATPVTCKETSGQCLEYEDLSRKRSPII